VNTCSAYPLILVKGSAMLNFWRRGSRAQERGGNRNWPRRSSHRIDAAKLCTAREDGGGTRGSKSLRTKFLTLCLKTGRGHRFDNGGQRERVPYSSIIYTSRKEVVKPLTIRLGKSTMPKKGGKMKIVSMKKVYTSGRGTTETTPSLTFTRLKYSFTNTSRSALRSCY
jgi:hypothetical protein